MLVSPALEAGAVPSTRAMVHCGTDADGRVPTPHTQTAAPSDFSKTRQRTVTSTPCWRSWAISWHLICCGPFIEALLRCYAAYKHTTVASDISGVFWHDAFVAGIAYCRLLPVPVAERLALCHVNMTAETLDCSQIDANAWDPLLMLPNCEVSSAILRPAKRVSYSPSLSLSPEARLRWTYLRPTPAVRCLRQMYRICSCPRSVACGGSLERAST
jgi:hypothetical protein